MKKLLMLFSIVGLLLLTGCPKPIEDPDEVLIRATVTLNISQTIHPLTGNSGGRTAVQVPGFDQKFGLVTLLLNNTVTGKPYFFDNTSSGGKTIQILVPAGNYDLIMESEPPSPFVPYTDYIPFTAEKFGVDIVEGSFTTLDANVDIGLVLFHKTGLDAAPTIWDYIPSTGISNYPATNMIDDVSFYYIYVYGTWGYRLSYFQGGVGSFLDRTFLAGKIYVYDINGSTVDTPDLFDEIITNN